jgi:EAL domain-containing protein (putative c-di-GMP-specific phosphodiesterase class I)
LGPPGAGGTLALRQVDLPRRLAGGARELRRMIAERAVVSHFQPIVRLDDGGLVAYEALCRGTVPELPELPAELLALADPLGLAAELSRTFRQAAVAAAGPWLGPPCRLFLNTHPAELTDLDRLLGSLEDQVRALPPGSLVLEIHEGAATDAATTRRLRQALAGPKVGLAYDDFGTGQTRLGDLIAAPPDYLKFDRSLICDLNDPEASGRRRQVLGSQVVMARDLGITTLAEGIERPGEAAAALECGFDLGQGHLFGRPEPAPVLPRP